MRTKRQRRGLHTNLLMIQDGEDAQDALSCRSLSTKEPLIVGLFCGKRPMKRRHLMHLRHPVFVRCRLVHLKTSNVYPSHLTYTQKTSTCAYLTFFLQIRTQDDAGQSELAHVCMRARVSVHCTPCETTRASSWSFICVATSPPDYRHTCWVASLQPLDNVRAAAPNIVDDKKEIWM